MRMFGLCSFLLVVAVIVAPAPAMAQTLTDWTGKTATLTEGVFDSNGLEMHYHTVGEGPLMVMLHGLGGPGLTTGTRSPPSQPAIRWPC